jgi:hypothetical protein
MLVARRLAGLSALVFDYAVGSAGAQSGGWGCSPSNWGATLGPLWFPILAGSPLKAPDGLKAPSHLLRAERGSGAA